MYLSHSKLLETRDVLSWGAEATLYNTEWFGLKAVIKTRIQKKYRNPRLDYELRKSRTILESRLLINAKKNDVRTPYVYEIDLNTTSIVMEKIEGSLLKNLLINTMPKDKQLAIIKRVGEDVGKLHINDIIHGDLTTSNIMLSNDQIVFIDFGLGKVSKAIEDKGVDILLMKKCFISTHTSMWKELFFAFQEGYLKTTKNLGQSVIKRAAKIEGRARHLSESEIKDSFLI